MIKAGIIGGSGYTGGELIRLILNHPEADLGFVFSTTRAGKPLHSAHPDLLGETDMLFSGEIDPEIDVVFLCLGHGNSRDFLSKNQFSKETKIIDLSNDFRLAATNTLDGKTFVYGLPELQREIISQARYIANPGCFATAIQLALLPLAASNQLQQTIHINAVTGSTGAGVTPADTTHFSWRNNNVSWYKPFTHQHLGEINQSLQQLDPETGELLFLPVRGNFARGIFATAYTAFSGSLEEAQERYQKYYESAAFTALSTAPVNLKQVVNTNYAHLHLHLHNGYLLITSVIDNLLKGASGQAVENMNLIFGLEQPTGLKLKGSAF
ncbi:N-acetyl-gamma-glutamyl-phosphate reductase [Robiginitalea myxolifaciens]|uniref:N-acetyl-gamma-glutamyl-phosphate reductase n=1 Tax=Robiginitalea myxolifaciens TaxID=400055 RepID=A0A1I6GA32_9FLAO|nr:N-acetyl-gamma-glutamyl-phosphate reductase [Robiginitalea myxolifaciens]SFR39044.1 N-acetyl-gamma-glutamyl-phosphate reductase [Robiginitalea myxolifaciens]